jgi:tRNA (cytidine/uridine-2'-O-)-methyltransferase
MRLALYQPEIAQNTGTLIRLGACLGFPLDIIEPCGFIMNDRKMKRSGMDYVEKVEIKRHDSWDAFQNARQNRRLILLSPIGQSNYLDFEYQEDDILLVGRESDGVPPEVRAACTHAVYIPMQPDCRSINVAIAAALVVGEALRQINRSKP